jgi:hypothetical protein
MSLMIVRHVCVFSTGPREGGEGTLHPIEQGTRWKRPFFVTFMLHYTEFLRYRIPEVNGGLGAQEREESRPSRMAWVFVLQNGSCSHSVAPFRFFPLNLVLKLWFRGFSVLFFRLEHRGVEDTCSLRCIIVE